MDQISLSYNLDLSSRSVWLAATAAPTVRSSFAYIQELGHFFCGPGYFTSRENLPSYLIKYCVDGEGILKYGGESYRIRPGEFFWIDCTQDQHYCTAPECAEWQLLWVHFYGPTCTDYYRAFLEENGGSPVCALGRETPLSDIFSGLFELYRDGNNTQQDDILASSLLTQLMVRCIQSAGAAEAENQAPRYVISVRKYIDENYQEDISLASLAKQFSINKFYLQKVFKRFVGLSPNDYLTRTRLTRAKHLLRTSSDTMTQIAHAVGYTSTYFDNVFKKYEGITPRAYRKRWYNAELH